MIIMKSSSPSLGNPAVPPSTGMASNERTHVHHHRFCFTCPEFCVAQLDKMLNPKLTRQSTVNKYISLMS